MPVRPGPPARVARHLTRLSRRDFVHHQSWQADTRQPILDGNARLSSRRRHAPRVRTLSPLHPTSDRSALYLIQLPRDDQRSGRSAFASHGDDDARWRCSRNVLFLTYMLAEGRMFWSPDSEDAAVFFIALVVFLGRAGRVWGVDSYLAKRWPKSPLW